VLSTCYAPTRENHLGRGASLDDDMRQHHHRLPHREDHSRRGNKYNSFGQFLTAGSHSSSIADQRAKAPIPCSEAREETRCAAVFNAADREKRRAIMSTLNKVLALMIDPTIRNIIGQ
jgi:hypothetical protein